MNETTSTTARSDTDARPWWRVPFAERFEECSFSVPQRAAAALDGLFPEEWLKAHEDEPHPVLGRLLHVPGLHDLALVGLAAADLALAPDTPKRLRNPMNFDGVAHELLVGLVLHLAGAELEHEPHAFAETGADWIACWPDHGRVAVEAKLINPSEVQRRAQRLLAFQVAALGHGLAPAGLDRLLLLDIEVPVQPLFEEALALDEEEAGAVVYAFFVNVNKAIVALLATTTAAGRHQLPNLGWVTIKHPDGTPGVQTATPMWTQEVDRAVARFGRPLRKADRQTRSYGLPGLVFVDQVRRSPFDGESIAAAALEEAEEVDNLAAIFIRGGGARIGTHGLERDIWFQVVPGPSAEDLPRPLLESLRRCGFGHYHFDPLVAPPTPQHCVMGNRA